MPPKTKKGLIARAIDKVSSTPFFGDPVKRGKEKLETQISDISIMEKKRQRPGGPYRGPGSHIKITTSAPEAPAKPAAKPSAPAKPAAKPAPYQQSVGSRQTSSPTTFRSDQAANMDKMLANFGSQNESAAASFRQNRVANEAKGSKKPVATPSTTRSKKQYDKGVEALKAGNLGKARRLRRRYDRIEKRNK